MRIRNCRVKVIDPSMTLAIGTMEEIEKMSNGKSIVVATLSFLPSIYANDITVNRLEDEVMCTLVEMCLRKALAVRDAMGNVVNDFGGWSYVQYKAISFLQGDRAEDCTNKLWYGIEHLYNQVFASMPYYALREIHYSIRSREIVFAGEYQQALNPYVKIINHYTDYCDPTSIVTKAVYAAGNVW